jgi:hypothetical protein
LTFPTGILARGPWEPDQVAVQWRDESFEPDPEQSAAADRAIAALAARPPTTASRRGSARSRRAPTRCG